MAGRSQYLVRQEGLEPPTYCLEGSCSIHMSYWRMFGAGDGNRTRVSSLEGWCSTIELHPQAVAHQPFHSSTSLVPCQVFLSVFFIIFRAGQCAHVVRPLAMFQCLTSSPWRFSGRFRGPRHVHDAHFPGCWRMGQPFPGQMSDGRSSPGFAAWSYPAPPLG